MAIGLLISVGSTNVYADSASDKAKIHQIQIQRKDIENKVEIINNQRETIMSKINSNEKNINITQKNIKLTKINIEKAEDDVNAEQIIFNKRARVMYINGSSSYITIMLGSNGLGDFISRIENIKTIVDYDQNVINNLKTKLEAINLKKVTLEAGNTKLLSLRTDNKKNLATLNKQNGAQNVLISKLNAQEKQYGAQLVIAQASELRQSIAAKQASDKLKKANAIRKEASKQVPGKPVAIKNEASDTDLLARLITAEAGGESYKAQVAVGAVVINRVESSSFPSSISDVITQKTNGSYEFTPVLNGNINRPAYASAVKAANEALSGNDPTNNALFFYSGKTPEGLTLPQPVSIKIGNLTFIFML
jgi:peptidoglycan hydrolase CwlO-like protein